MASEALLQSAGVVAKKLAKWLEESGYIEKETANRVIRLAAEAARELPAAERLARLIYEYAQSHAPRYWTAELDDYFVIDQIHPGILILSGHGDLRDRRSARPQRDNRPLPQGMAGQPASWQDQKRVVHSGNGKRLPQLSAGLN